MAWKNVLLKISEVVLVYYSQRYDYLILLSFVHNDIFFSRNSTFQRILSPWLCYILHIITSILTCTWWRRGQGDMFKISNSLPDFATRPIFEYENIFDMGLEILVPICGDHVFGCPPIQWFLRNDYVNLIHNFDIYWAFQCYNGSYWNKEQNDNLNSRFYFHLRWKHILFQYFILGELDIWCRVCF